MNKKITFIRHAQSKYNLKDINTEEYRNTGLTFEGKDNSKTLDHEFDILIVSPLRRAVETYASSNLKCGFLLTNKLFREYLEFMCYPDFFHNETMVLETKEDIEKRVKKALDYIKGLNGEKIGIISHHNFIKNFFKINFDKDVDLKNCEVIEMTI